MAECGDSSELTAAQHQLALRLSRQNVLRVVGAEAGQVIGIDMGREDSKEVPSNGCH